MNVRATEWHTQALCARPDMAPYRDLFFPHPGEVDKAEAAKRICAACPVRLECLADALVVEGGRGMDSRHGIRGGLSPAGRRRRYDRQRKARQAAGETKPKAPERKKRKPAECGTRGGYQRHLRQGTPICAPCRQANTDADNRLRRTGTTKASA